MKKTFQYVDIEACNAAGSPPVDLLSNPTPFTWLVAGKHLNMDGFAWNIHENALDVFVPLLPYLVVGNDAENALGFVFQLGAEAARRLPAGSNVIREHISIGVPLEETETEVNGVLTPCFRFWLGVAYRIG